MSVYEEKESYAASRAGGGVKYIPLSKGQVAIVDADKFDGLNAFKWCATWTTTGFYVMRMTAGSHASRRRVFMHRHLLGLPMISDGRLGDHINGNTLDNRLANLRIATPSQNQMNRAGYSKTITGVKGVSYDKSRDRLEVKIRIQGKSVRIARFLPSQMEEAAQCYREAVSKYYGEFARIE